MKLNLGFTKSYFPLVDSQYLFIYLFIAGIKLRGKDKGQPLGSGGKGKKWQAAKKHDQFSPCHKNKTELHWQHWKVDVPNRYSMTVMCYD